MVSSDSGSSDPLAMLGVGPSTGPSLAYSSDDSSLVTDGEDAASRSRQPLQTPYKTRLTPVPSPASSRTERVVDAVMDIETKNRAASATRQAGTSATRTSSSSVERLLPQRALENRTVEVDEPMQSGWPLTRSAGLLALGPRLSRRFGRAQLSRSVRKGSLQRRP